jgi:hypothetical protein
MADWRLEGPYMKNCNCDPDQSGYSSLRQARGS